MAMASRALGSAFYATVLALAACGGGSTGDSGGAATVDASVAPVDASEAEAGDSAPLDAAAPSDASDADAAPFTEAPHASPPQVLTYGGPVLTAPKIVPIFYTNDPLQTQVEQYLAALAASAYWPSVTTEYGVGPLSIAPSIVVTDPIPAMTTDPEIIAWLASYLDGTHAGWPAIETNDIFMVFYQSATTITYETTTSTQTSCVNFGGYHNEGVEGSLDAGGLPFVYAVIPRCAQFDTFTGLDAVTDVTSHEAIEAATDPLDVTAPAYLTADPDHFVWSLGPGGEVGDMCEYEPQSLQRLVGNFLVQRIWSNRAALAGGDPCVPPLAETVYFNAAPDLSELVDVKDEYGYSYRTLGARIPVGQSATVMFRFFSAGPTDEWQVYLTDTSVAFHGPQLLTFTPATLTGNNGDVVPVTVTADATSYMGGAEMMIEAYRPSDQTYINYWFGFVEN
jgi:hypothetical protein